MPRNQQEQDGFGCPVFIFENPQVNKKNPCILCLCYAIMQNGVIMKNARWLIFVLCPMGLTKDEAGGGKEKQEVHHYGSCFYETVIGGWCSFRTSD